MRLWLSLISINFLLICRAEDIELEAEALITSINKGYTPVLKKQSLADWQLELQYQPGIVGESVNADDQYAAYVKGVSGLLSKYRNREFVNKTLERQIKKFPTPGYDALSNEDYKELTDATYNMAEIYTNVKLCSYKNPDNCNLTLIPDVQDILHNSKDIEEIKYYWIEWRIRTGLRVKKSFETFLDLYRKTAALNNFTKPSELWFNEFEDDNIINKIQTIIEKIHPLFQQFHAHVRHLLQEKYGAELVQSNKPYPLHLSEILLGEAFRYQEDGVVQLPYPEKLIPNITEELIRQNYTPRAMFDASREFYASIGMPVLPSTYWDENVLPVLNSENNVLHCFSKAWQTYVKNRVGVSYCPEVDLRRYLNMYQVMSDIYYYLQFQNQSTILQNPPLPNFDDVFSQSILLSISSTKYLENVGLLQKGAIDYETRINRLYLKGMETIFLLPILFVLDKYRVQMLDLEIPSWDNCKYWKLTEMYTGGEPPVSRTNNDFDVPAKLLTRIDHEYSSHILSTIMQYQVFKHFCQKVGEYIPGNPDFPLDNCNLAGHTEVGEAFKEAMALGSSKTWHEVLEVLTGQSEPDPSGFLEYFQPLFEWLAKDNLDKNINVGWEQTMQCM